MSYYVQRGRLLIGPYRTLSSASFAAHGAGYEVPSNNVPMRVVDRYGQPVDTSMFRYPEKRARKGFLFNQLVSVSNPQGGYAAIQRPVHSGDWLRAIFGRYH